MTFFFCWKIHVTKSSERLLAFMTECCWYSSRCPYLVERSATADHEGRDFAQPRAASGRAAFPGKSRSISSHLLTTTGPAPESNYEHIKGFPHEAFVWQDLSQGPVMMVGLAALHFIHLISLTPSFLQFLSYYSYYYHHSYISRSSFFKHVMSSAAFMIYCLSSSLLIRSYRSASFPSANVQGEGRSYSY